MPEAKKIRYLSKTVAFAGKSLTLFSIDGLTWSSRKQELLEIKERQERDKVSFAAIKESEEGAAALPSAKKKVISDDEEDTASIVAEEDYPIVDYSLDETEGQSKRKGRGRPAKPTVEPKAALKQQKQKLRPVSKAKAISNKSKPKKAKKLEKKKASKAAPKKRVTAKPKLKASKGKQKGKKRAA